MILAQFREAIEAYLKIANIHTILGLRPDPWAYALEERPGTGILCVRFSYANGEPWPTQALEYMKARLHDLSPVWLCLEIVTTEAKRRKYGDQCPCGCHPSLCDYHRDVLA